MKSFHAYLEFRGQTQTATWFQNQVYELDDDMGMKMLLLYTYIFYKDPFFP